MRANDDHDFDAAFDQMRVGSEAVAPTLQKFVSISILFEQNKICNENRFIIDFDRQNNLQMLQEELKPFILEQIDAM